MSYGLQNTIIGTVKVSPDHIDAFSWCRGDPVRLRDRVYYRYDITDIGTARMVARNLSPSDAAVAILETKAPDGNPEYLVYTLDHDVEFNYAKDGSDIVFSTLHRMGESLPAGVKVVEIYNKQRIAFIQKIIDTEPLHPYPTIDDPVVCVAGGQGNIRKILDWKSERVVGNRVFYAYHTIPREQLERDFASYKAEPELADMSSADIDSLAFMLDRATTIDKILKLDATTIMAAGPTQRAQLIETVLDASDLRDDERAIVIITLLQAIPETVDGRDAKTEIRSTIDKLKVTGAMERIWEVCESKYSELLFEVLLGKGAPDNIFSPEITAGKMAASWTNGVLDWVGSILNTTQEIASDPLGAVTCIGGVLLQYGVDRIALSTFGETGLTEEASRRSGRLESAVMGLINKKIESHNAAWRFGVGYTYSMTLAGRLTPDIVLTTRSLQELASRTTAKITRLQQLMEGSSEMELLISGIGKVSQTIRRWTPVFYQTSIF